MVKFSQYIQDKNVLLVGPSDTMTGRGLGSLIDSYDVVCRMNKHAVSTKINNDDFGTRCDVIYLNGYCCDNYNIREIEKTWIVTKYSIGSKKKRFTDNLRGVRQYLVNRGVNEPLMGTLATVHIMLNHTKTTTIMGFDWYSMPIAHATGYNDGNIFDYEKVDLQHDIKQNILYIDSIRNRIIMPDFQLEIFDKLVEELKQ